MWKRHIENDGIRFRLWPSEVDPMCGLSAQNPPDSMRPVKRPKSAMGVKWGEGAVRLGQPP